MPLAARLTILAVIAILCAGAVYLLAVRGPALLLDLSGTVGRVLCL